MTETGLKIVHLGPGDREKVMAAGHLFDGTPRPDATDQFLSEPGHHLLVAYQDGVPAGFVSGVETTHPDKGTEMFLYELGVDEPYLRRGIGAALVQGLSVLAQERGCYGMWVGTDDDNPAALATYARAGAKRDEVSVIMTWRFGDS